jgi:hypothetical protein
MGRTPCEGMQGLGDAERSHGMSRIASNHQQPGKMHGTDSLSHLQKEPTLLPYLGFRLIASITER